MSEQNTCFWCGAELEGDETMCDECESRYGCIPGDDRLYDVFKETLPDGVIEQPC